MTLQESLRAELLLNSTLAAKVNSQIFPGVSDQNTVGDFITIREISGYSYHSHDGDTGLRNARIEITYWSASHGEASRNLLLVDLSMKNFSGNLGTTGVSVQVFGKQGPRDVTDPKRNYFGRQIDYLMHVDGDTES